MGLDAGVSMKFIPVLLLIASTFVGALGALLVKRGTTKFRFMQLWKSREVFGGFLLYTVSVFLYLLALKQEELSVVYPMVAMSYFWITLFAVKFLDEKLNRWKIIGLVGILCGFVLIGMGS